MRILTISTLFPRTTNPKHGIFVETRLRHLRQTYPDLEIKVIAPVPYFPFSHNMFGSYAEFAQAPYFERRHDMDVYHPRYLVVPKVGTNLTPFTLEHAIYKQAKKILDDGYDFDLIDGHYFYPNGVAVAKVAKRLNKPYIMTARGTDINLMPQYEKPREMIQQVLEESDHNIAVCEALRQEMITLGAKPGKVTTLRNGVDLKLFPFTDKNQQMSYRTQLGLPTDTPVVISVGLLIERKGHHLAIEAMKELPEVTLLIAGDGPEQKKLEQLTQELGLDSQVRFLGSMDQPTLAKYYGASDALILASSREGWANVLLESMACGTPVVATNIWGTPEVVQNETAGELVERKALDIATGVKQLLNREVNRKATRHYAEQFSWNDTINKKYQLISRIINNNSCNGEAAL